MKLQSYTFFLLCLLIGTVQPLAAQLNEGFEGSFPPAGWTVLENGVGPTYQWQRSTQNPNSGNAHAFVRFTNVNNALAEDWLVTPKLLPDVGDNTLTFYATDDFAENYASVYTVRVSTTSATNRASFEIIATYVETDFTNDVYQQFMVDLSAYNGEEIYVAFVLENTNGDSFLLDDVSGPLVVPVETPPNCDAALIKPAPNATGVSLDPVLMWSAATGDPSGYKIQIGTTSGGDDFLSLTDVGAALSYDPVDDFRLETTYYVSIIPYNDNGEAFVGDCPVYSFTTQEDPNILLDCAGAATPVNRTWCYESSVTESFLIGSNNGQQVRLVFNAGTVENGQDELYIYDGSDASGTLLNPTKLYGNGGNLAGLSYVSTTGSLFVELTPDASNDCVGGDQTTIDFTASCLDCIPPAGTAAAGTCDDNSGQFFIDLDITGLGDGTVIVSNDQNATTQNVTTTGITAVGPFNFGTVVLTLQNATDANCTVELPAVRVQACTPANDDCLDAIALSLSPDGACANAASGTTAGATVSANSGVCSVGAPDVWYSFTPATTDTYVFSLANGNPLTSVAIYDGDCTGGLQLLSAACRNNERTEIALTGGQTYLVQVAATAEVTAGPFDLCVFVLPLAPSNDLCAGATVISCPDGGSLSGEDAAFATATDAAGCNGQSIGAGLWYVIAGTGDYLSITATPNGWDAALQVWSGADCGSRTCITQVNDGTTGAAESVLNLATTPGTNYYIYVGGYNSSEIGGLFNLSVNCSELPMATVTCLDDPENDPCNELIVEDGMIEGTVAACNEVTTSGAVVVGTGTSAEFVAGTKVTLSAGFKAEAGSVFSAYIAPCDPPAIQEAIVENQLLANEAAAAPAADLKLRVSPNPILDEARVQIHAAEDGMLQVVLTDINGKILLVRELDAIEGWNEMILQRNGLHDGLYFLSIRSSTAQSMTKIVFGR